MDAINFDQFTIDELSIIGGCLMRAAPRAGLEDWDDQEEWDEAEIIFELAGRFIGAFRHRRYVRDCYLDLAAEACDAGLEGAVDAGASDTPEAE